MSTDISAVTSHFPSAQNGFTTTTSGSVSSGAATVGLNSVAGYSNGQIAVFVIDPADSNKKQTFTGTIDAAGVQVTNVVWTAGTNTTHTAGATVVDYETATHWSMVTKGILVHADQDGTLKAGAVDNAAVLANGVVSPNKLATGAAYAYVATAQTTSSTTATDLATAGPAVTVTIGNNGLAWVSISSGMLNDTSGSYAEMSFAVSGATTLAAGLPHRIYLQMTSGSQPDVGMSYSVLLTGLTPGSTTFTAKYRAIVSGTARFAEREISVIPL